MFYDKDVFQRIGIFTDKNLGIREDELTRSGQESYGNNKIKTKLIKKNVWPYDFSEINH